MNEYVFCFDYVGWYYIIYLWWLLLFDWFYFFSNGKGVLWEGVLLVVWVVWCIWKFDDMVGVWECWLGFVRVI